LKVGGEHRDAGGLLTEKANRDIISFSWKVGMWSVAKGRSSTKTDRMLRTRIGCLVRQVQLMLLLIVAVAMALAVFAARQKGRLGSVLGVPTATSGRYPTLQMTATPTRSSAVGPTITPGGPTLSPTSEPKRKRVGILAGHYGPENDPGAVCPDGVREVDINLAVAERVVAALRQRGYRVDLLEEYDDRLHGYQADALLSIHSDACDIPEASGFKVARVSFSAIPEVEDVLVECLYEEYGRITRLPRHDYSITPDMHGYHAFVEINPQTPGAIIEMGFMAADRYILVNRPDLLAHGIVAGLVCFLEQ
jgi:N-acetylmuramoyl-L-alanine amidase